MLNKVIIIGNLGRDPEVRSTQNGTQVANLRVATMRKWWDKQSNSRKEETEWHTVVMWGRQAEVAGQYLTRGRLIAVEGRLQTRSWEDRQTGSKRYSTEIVCENFQMLGGRDGNRDAGGYGQDQSRGGYQQSGGYGAGGGYNQGQQGGGGYGGGGDSHGQSQQGSDSGGGDFPASGGDDTDDDLPF